MIFFEQKKFVILAKFIYEKFLNNLLFVFCTSNLFPPQVHENFFFSVARYLAFRSVILILHGIKLNPKFTFFKMYIHLKNPL